MAPEPSTSPSDGARRRFRLDHFERGMLALAAAILIYQLVIPPVVGVFDNGDWGKIMGPLGLEHMSNTPEEMHQFLNLKFRFTSPWWGNGYIVSGRLVARIARTIGLVVSKDGLFDLRVLGLLHAALLVWGLALIMRAASVLHPISRRVLAVLLVFVFTDVGYVAFLNSFYSQAESLCFLVIAAGFFALIVCGRSWRWCTFLGFVAAATLFAASKPQEAPQALFLAALALLAARVLGPRRAAIIGVFGAALIIAAAGVCYWKASRVVREPVLYNAFFQELLGNSPNPVNDLSSLGLNPDMARYAGTHAFVADSPIQDPAFRAAFFDRMSSGRVLLFYLARPSRLWELLKRRSASAFTIVTHYGNFEKRAGFPQGTRSSAFKVWSDFKRRALPGSIWTVLLFFLGSLATAVFLYLRKATAPHHRVGLLAFAALNLMALGAFLICAVGDGTLDIVRQLYTFNAMTDLCLIAEAVALVEVVRRRWDRA